MSKASSSLYPPSAAAPHLKKSKPLRLKNNTVKDTSITTALKFNQAGGANKASHSATTAMLQVSFLHLDERSRDHMIVVDYNLLCLKPSIKQKPMPRGPRPLVKPHLKFSISVDSSKNVSPGLLPLQHSCTGYTLATPAAVIKLTGHDA